MTISNKNYQFHHMGIPTKEEHPNERYSEMMDMYTSDIGTPEFRVQYHRFGPKCTLHPLIQTVPHAAFIVPNLEEAVENKNIIMAIYEPIEGFKTAMIEENGAPIELIETTMTEDQIWNGKKENSKLYQKGK